MKTYREILQEISDQMKTGHFDLGLITELAAIRYAKQCCEDLRKRCFENAEIDYCSLPDMEPFISESSILETKIILP